MSRPARTARLGVLALAMVNVASIVSARNLPVMAEYGWSMLLLFALSIAVFLVPVSMAAAELGTAFPRDGGVYAWVKEAFGGRTGFLAVWCDYAENVAWFPTVLSFIAASSAYAIDPSLADDRTYLVVVMLVVFWGTTAAALRGVRTSAVIGAVGTVAGSILPALLVVVLGAAFLLRGDASQIPFSAGALVPDVSLGNLAFLGGIILLFTGMEMAGFHARETRDPGRTVPRAVALAVAVTVTFSVLGSLFMAFVLPRHEISLVSGTMELFASVLDTLSVSWLLTPLAVLVVLGGVAHLTPWVLGPAKGVAVVAREGLAPGRFGRTNRNDVPVALLVLQGLAGVEAGHLHAGEQQDDAAEEGHVPQRDLGHQRAGREGDLGGVAAQQERRPEHHDEQRRQDRPGDGADGADHRRRAHPAQRGGRRAPEDDEHDDQQVGPVVGQRRVDRVRRGRGDERQHGGEPGDVLGVVAPHREEAGAPAEGFLHPRVHPALAREGGAELGGGHRHRDEEHQDRQGEQQQHRPAVLGHDRQVARADDGGDVDHRQREHAQAHRPRRPGHRAPCSRSAPTSRRRTPPSPAPCTSTVASPRVSTVPLPRGRTSDSNRRAAASRSAAEPNRSSTTVAASPGQPAATA